MAKKKTSYSKTLAMIEPLGLRKTIDELMLKESKYIPVASICNEYLQKLDQGYAETELCESFITELSKVAVNSSSKDAVYSLSTAINEHARDIKLVNCLLEMQRSQYGYVVPMIESAIVTYITDKTAENREAARKSIDLFEGISGIATIQECLSFDEYEEKTGTTLKQFTLNEAMIPVEEEKTFTQAEVNAMLESAKAEATPATPAKTHADIKSYINLDSVINNILVKESKNESLKAFCQQYIYALNNGKCEEVLYESFISGASNWRYLNAVDTELSAMHDRISKYKQDIDIKKIFEIMKETASYYLLPLIETRVVEYLDNKNENTKAVLRQYLHAFEYDPFVRDIVRIIELDQSFNNKEKLDGVYLGEAIEILNNKVRTEKIYSPILFIKENECVFNVKGTYYSRKGNSISKLSKSSVASLNESYKTLCNVMNHSSVVVNEGEDSITIYDGSDKAVISEMDIVLNESRITTDELNNLSYMSHLMHESKDGFYNAIRIINENFDKIGYIDFVKHVAMNESTDGRSVHVFKIKDNIFVTTINENMGTSTFYRNVNPIQCRTYINEHMDINVAPLFEDVLPDQDAVEKNIEDTKQQYEIYIEDLKSKKEELLALADESEDDAEYQEALKMIDDELADVEKSYKEYQTDADSYTGVAKNSDVEIEDPDADATADIVSDPADVETPVDDAPLSDMNPDEIESDVDAPIETEIDDAPIASYDSDFDVPANDNFEIVRISYSENVKTGTKTNKGEAIVIIPSVDANGDIKNETRTVSFYLDPERNPVINNEYMPLALYNAIKTAIVNSPDTAEIDTTSAGVADEPINMDDIETSLAEIPAEDENPSDEISSTVSADSLSDEAPITDEPIDMNTEIEEVPADDSVADEETNVDDDIDSLLNSILPDDSAQDATDIQETPAETAEKGDEIPEYPIDIDLDLEDIAPISSARFEESCKKMGIKCAKLESEENAVRLQIANKAQAYAFADYFKDWKNYSEKQFCNFFPELKKCFNNKCSSIPVAESVSIVNVQAINESAVLSESKTGGIKIILPNKKEYSAVLGVAENTTASHIEVITESYDETKAIYESLARYAATCDTIDADLKSFLERYAVDFGTAVNESYTITVPYNGFLETKLESKGIEVNVINESMHIVVLKENAPAAKRIFESFYTENIPASVTDFFQCAEELLEGLKITIKDDRTGKTVEIDTDDLKDDKEPTVDSTTDFDPFKDTKDTTFDFSKSVLYSSDDDSSDDADDDKKEDEDDDNKKKEITEEPENNDISTQDDKSEVESEEAKETTEEPESEDKDEHKEEPKKKKFMFRPKKKKTDESVEVSNTGVSINESITTKAPNLMDFVRFKSNPHMIGQIIFGMPNGDFIINVEGRTIQCKPSEIELVNTKIDTVDAPYKFDPKTLKGLFEQFVPCGLFMNGNCISPSRCFTKYDEYLAASDDDNIRIMCEGQVSLAQKRYIKITEDINNFANINDYLDGEQVSSTGTVLRKILFNKKDYNNATSETTPIKCLVTDENGEYHFQILPAGDINPEK